MRSLLATFLQGRHSRRGRAWLLCVAILLPVAQMAAHWHVLSHVHSSQTEEGQGKQGIHEDPCALCLTAATVIGSAPLAAPAALPVVAGLYAAPQVLPRSNPQTALTRTYLSRAPPPLFLR